MAELVCRICKAPMPKGWLQHALLQHTDILQKESQVLGEFLPDDLMRPLQTGIALLEAAGRVASLFGEENVSQPEKEKKLLLGEWQKCPICNGAGLHRAYYPTAEHPDVVCVACEGKGLIMRPPLP